MYLDSLITIPLHLEDVNSEIMGDKTVDLLT